VKGEFTPVSKHHAMKVYRERGVKTAKVTELGTTRLFTPGKRDPR
jgi:hypothetical protein